MHMMPQQLPQQLPLQLCPLPPSLAGSVAVEGAAAQSRPAVGPAAGFPAGGRGRGRGGRGGAARKKKKKTADGTAKYVDDLADQPPMPFVCSRAQIAEASRRSRALLTDGMLPSEVAYVQLHQIFRNPSFLKMHDWLVVMGPILKYLLSGFLGKSQRKAMFKYIDAVSRIWCKSITKADGKLLVTEVKTALADMEINFPAWDLDMNRHMVDHVAESIAPCGAPWTHTTFPFERFWKK